MTSEHWGFTALHRAESQGSLEAFSPVACVATSAHSQTLIVSPGPSSRRTPIAITEIMYKPAARLDGRNTEYIELYNLNPWPEDISAYRLDGQVQFKFPSPTQISAQGYAL